MRMYEYKPKGFSAMLMEVPQSEWQSKYNVSNENGLNVLDEGHASDCGGWANIHRYAIKDCVIKPEVISGGMFGYSVVCMGYNGNEPILHETFRDYKNAEFVRYMALNGVEGGVEAFKLPLMACIGETVWYINPKFDIEDDTVSYDVDNIRECIVTKVNLVSDLDSCTLTASGLNGEYYGAIQECFFHSLSEAINVVNILKCIHDNGEDSRRWNVQLCNVREICGIKHKYTVIPAEKKWAKLTDLEIHGFGYPKFAHDVAITRVLFSSEENVTEIEYGITPEAFNARNEHVYMSNSQFASLSENGLWRMNDTGEAVQFVACHVHAEDITRVNKKFKVIRECDGEEVNLYTK